MDLRKQFAVDATLEREGVWVDMGEGAAIRIARLNSEQYRRALRRRLEPHKVRLRLNKVPEELLERLTVETLAETVLIDWRGIEDGGEPLTYSREAAERLLTDLPEFREFVVAQAGDLALFQQQRVEAEQGN